MECVQFCRDGARLAVKVVVAFLVVAVTAVLGFECQAVFADSPPPSPPTHTTTPPTPPTPPTHPTPPTAQASPATVSPAERLDRLVERYGAIETYQARVDFETRSTTGRITSIEQTYYDLAFDRAGKRVVLVGPWWELMIEDDVVRMKTEQLPGGYLETHTGEAFGGGLVSVLQSVAPMVVSPLIPDLGLLMEEPDQAIARLVGRATGLTHTPEGVMSPQGENVYRVVIDETGERLLGVTFETEGGNGSARPTRGVSFAMTITAFDEPVDEEAFAFDVEGLVAYDTIQQWAQASGMGRGGGGGGGHGGGGIEGQDAPPVVLDVLDGEKFDLKDVGDDVVVLDFWASWCQPCWIGLAELDKVKKWADTNGLGVRVLAINLEEDEKTARDAVKALKVDLPVLMDLDGAVARAYRVEPLPTTVMIHHGKIELYLMGLAPNQSEILKERIMALHERDKTKDVE